MLPFWRRALLHLGLVLSMAAGPWLQPALAQAPQDIPAMAICSVANTGGAGNAGGTPAHAAAHCQLCCGNQTPYPLPAADLPGTAASGISYPVARAWQAGFAPSLAPGAKRARAPPAA
ncbi:hypothetical protein FB597_102456 [Herbaspirillum sp. SJZ099]|nr:hypothetical protein FB597_102456 [Herbaspirillum sp. SJZ099]